VTCDRSVVFSGYSGFLHQTDRHNIIAEILLKVALNTMITHNPYSYQHSLLKLRTRNLSDDCLTPSKKFFSYIMTRTSYISTRWRWCRHCTRSICSSWIFKSASSLKHQSVGRNVALIWTPYHDSEQASVCSYYLMQRA
jgi:hypothetical protein